MRHWCNSHNRFAVSEKHCEGPKILLPCDIVDLDAVGIEILCDCELSGEVEVAPCEICYRWRNEG